MTLTLIKGTQLAVEEQGYAPLRRLVTGLPPRRPGLDYWPVHVRFVVDKVALEQVFLLVIIIQSFTLTLILFLSGFGSVLAFGTQVRWFKPARSRRIFQGEKKSSERLTSEGK